MKAAYIARPGPAESIHYGDFPTPGIADSEVLVQVSAVTVDPVDTYIRSGSFPMNIPLPFIIGRDMVGIVSEVGPAVRKFQSGDRVWSNCMGIHGRQGTFAQYIAVPEALLFPLPSGVDPIIAVAVVHSALTATIGLFTKAQLKAGDRLFINGGSGNVGTAVLQIASSSGAHVAVTAGSPEKEAWCRQLGADRVINYHSENVVEAIKDFAPDGLDIYWDATPMFDMEQALTVVGQNAHIVVMAGMQRRTILPVGPFYTLDCTLHGFVVTNASNDQIQTSARQINGWLAQGKLRAKIAQVLPLSQAAKAHRLLEQNNLFGKLILLPQG